MTFKDKYKEELHNLSFKENFEENTVELLKAAQREDNLMSDKKRPLKVAALVIIAMLVLSLGVYAAISLLSASQVAEEVGDKELAVLFEESGFEPVTVKGEVYSVTFMGTAPGENFYSYDENGPMVSENRTYAVWAVYRNDGEALDQMAGSPIQVIPVIDGYRPDILFSAGMSASGYSKDGVLYYLFECTDLEIFAHEHVKLMAFEGMFPTNNIITSDSKGEIVYAEGYNGFKAAFELDLDESKADPEAAAEFISQF